MKNCMTCGSTEDVHEGLCKRCLDFVRRHGINP